LKEGNSDVQASSDSDDWPLFHHDLGRTGNSLSEAPNTNETLWIKYHEPFFAASSSPIIHEGMLFTDTLFGFSALHSETGEWIWNYTETEMGRLSIPAVGYGRVYFGTEFGMIYALDEFTGDLVWEYSGSSGIESSPAIANGWVYVGLEEGALIALNATDGYPMWKYDQVARVESSPALYSGTIYFHYVS